MRKIPSSMASQHPDHATVPYWHSEALVTAHVESQEAFLSFSDFGIDEHMWDWEGKLVDEAVLERLLAEHYDFFQAKPIGQDFFLTFRLPNPKVETEFRMGRALMGILGASSLAHQLSLPFSPLFEVVLPMTESAEELINIQAAFKEIASLRHPIYRLDKGMLEHLEVIPLFEQVQTLMDSDKILEKYVQLHQREFGFAPVYIRPFMARSDPALNSGIVPVVLATKVGLSHYHDFTKRTGIALYPIIGAGSLPFRGGLTPATVAEFAREYSGVKTAMLQSAFRYDFDKTEVLSGVQKLAELLPQSQPLQISAADEQKIRQVVLVFEEFYTSTVEKIAPVINQLAGQLPKRRERVQHIGLFGYSRDVGKVKLPRAIGFTAALYSLGVPPELIGTGRGLAATTQAGQLEIVEKFYLNLRSDLKRAGRYLNKKVLKQLADRDSAWQAVQEDVKAVESFLGESLGPETSQQLKHQQLTRKIFTAWASDQKVTDLIEKAAVLRNSMG